LGSSNSTSRGKCIFGVFWRFSSWVNGRKFCGLGDIHEIKLKEEPDEDIQCTPGHILRDTKCVPATTNSVAEATEDI
jgi:hypothetical protein